MMLLRGGHPPCDLPSPIIAAGQLVLIRKGT